MSGEEVTLIGMIYINFVRAMKVSSPKGNTAILVTFAYSKVVVMPLAQ